MTTEATDMAVVQRGLDNLPRPAMDQLPKGSAVRQLAEVLGRPHLARRVSELLGQHVSVVLAQAVDDVVTRRATEIEAKVEARLSAEYAARFAAELDQAHTAIVTRWHVEGNQPEPDCVAPEPDLDCPGCECCTEDECGESAQCIASLCRCFTDQPADAVDGTPELWATRVDLRQPPSVLAGVFGRVLDEAERAEQARIDRFMAGGDDV